MNFEFEQRFSSPIEAVGAACASSEIIDLWDDLPELSRPVLLEHNDDGERVFQRVRFAFIGSVSPALTALVDPSRLTWIEESEFDRHTNRRRFRIVPEHYGEAMNCEGTTDLQAIGAETVRRTHAELTVNIPVIAAMAQEAIVSALRQLAVAEAVAIRRWLGRQNSGGDGQALSYARRSASYICDDASERASVASVSETQGGAAAAAAEGPPAEDGTSGVGHGEPRASPLQELLRVFGDQWRQVGEAIVLQVVGQLRQGMAGVSSQWQTVAAEHSAQMADQWAKIVRNLNEETFASPQGDSPLVEVGEAFAKYHHDNREQLAQVSLAVQETLRSVVGEVNAGLAGLSRQFNDELAKTAREFRFDLNQGGASETPQQSG